MNNIYEILERMNAVEITERKGSKPDFLDLDKDGNRTEPMAQAARQAYQSSKAGAQKAISGQDVDCYPKTSKVAEDDMEEGNEFTSARLAAIRAGRPTFKLNGKTYRVTGDTSDEKAMMEREFHTRDEFDDRAEPGDTYKRGNMTITKTKGGIHVRHETDYDPGKDDANKDKDEGPKKRGRPKGTKRALGAKGPTGKSKLLKKGAIKEEGMDDEGIALVDKGEYDREGEMAKDQLHTIEAAAKELHDILGDDENLPEWVQSKITKAADYIDTARDYMLSQHQGEEETADDEETMMPERKLTKPEMRKREEIVKSMKKGKGDFEKRYGERGEEVMYATATKLAKKKAEEGKEEMEETTTSGSVATAPAAEKPKKVKGMIFGKGVYESQISESFDGKLKQVLTEGVSINASQNEDGSKTLNVTATDDDAVKLAQILRLAGMPRGHDHGQVCPGCGQDPCACEEGVAEGEYANSPDVEESDTETMVNTLSGGLNKQKSTGQTTIPMPDLDPARQGVRAVAEQIQAEHETRLWDLYKRYEG